MSFLRTQKINNISQGKPFIYKRRTILEWEFGLHFWPWFRLTHGFDSSWVLKLATIKMHITYYHCSLNSFMDCVSFYEPNRLKKYQTLRFHSNLKYLTFGAEMLWLICPPNSSETNFIHLKVGRCYCQPSLKFFHSNIDFF